MEDDDFEVNISIINIGVKRLRKALFSGISSFSFRGPPSHPIMPHSVCITQIAKHFVISFALAVLGLFAIAVKVRNKYIKLKKWDC